MITADIFARISVKVECSRRYAVHPRVSRHVVSRQRGRLVHLVGLAADAAASATADTNTATDGAVAADHGRCAARHLRTAAGGVGNRCGARRKADALQRHLIQRHHLVGVELVALHRRRVRAAVVRLESEAGLHVAVRLVRIGGGLRLELDGIQRRDGSGRLLRHLLDELVLPALRWVRLPGGIEGNGRLFGYGTEHGFGEGRACSTANEDWNSWKSINLVECVCVGECVSVSVSDIDELRHQKGKLEIGIIVWGECGCICGYFNSAVDERENQIARMRAHQMQCVCVGL